MTRYSVFSIFFSCLACLVLLGVTQTTGAAEQTNAFFSSGEDIMGSGTVEDVMSNVGISVMTKKMMRDSPINKLRALAGPEGGMGSRLGAVMRETGGFESTPRLTAEDFTGEDYYSNMIVDAIDENMGTVELSDRMYPPRLAIDFKEYPVSLGEAELRQRIVRLNRGIQSRFNALGGGRITLELQEETLVLQGTVPSDRDRSVVEMMVKMEPGIDRVRNELRIGSTPEPSNSPVPSPAEFPASNSLNLGNSSSSLLDSLEAQRPNAPAAPKPRPNTPTLAPPLDSPGGSR